MMEIKKRGIKVSLDEKTGNLIKIEDEELGFKLLKPGQKSEIHFNGKELSPKLENYELTGDNLLSSQEYSDYICYSAGYTFKVNRSIQLKERKIIFSYQIHREKSSHLYPVPGPNSGPVEAPFWLEHIDTPVLNWRLFGRETYMMVAHLGNGPSEHIDFDEGPLEKIVPKLWHPFRKQGLGVQTFPGALYYHPKKQDWLLIYCRRPWVGYQAEYTSSGMHYQFLYFTHFLPGQVINVPSVIIEWRRGLDNAYRRIADLFQYYEEPPEWWYHTTWVHIEFPHFRDFIAPLEILSQGGINGIWITGHSRPQGYYGTTPESYQPNPFLGGEKSYAQMMKKASELGYKKIVWFSGSGFFEGKDFRSSWAIRGIDGRHWVAWSNPYQEHLIGCNPLDPDWQKYTLKWILRYIDNYDIDGIFLDCGVFPFPPDFGDKPYQKYPSLSLIGYINFIDLIYEETRRRKPGFVIFLEGAHSDLKANVFTIVADRISYTGRNGQDFIESLRKYGLRICYWSGKPYDLASGMPFINPSPLRPPQGDKKQVINYFFKKIANNKMNQFICKLVKEKGCREAIRLAPNVSQLKDLIICGPNFSGKITFSGKREKEYILKDLLTGKTLHPGEGVYRLPLT